MANVHFKSRMVGKDNLNFRAIKYYIENDKSVLVAGLEDPSEIVKRLKESGVEVNHEKSYTRFDNGKYGAVQKHTGIIFTLKK